MVINTSWIWLCTAGICLSNRGTRCAMGKSCYDMHLRLSSGFEMLQLSQHGLDTFAWESPLEDQHLGHSVRFLPRKMKSHTGARTTKHCPFSKVGKRKQQPRDGIWRTDFIPSKIERSSHDEVTRVTRYQQR